MASLMTENQQKLPLDPHLKALENEAIYIFREVVAEFTNPVMLYSVGKDSSFAPCEKSVLSWKNSISTSAY